ncbi:flavin-containing monooxygenase [Fictibacillus aquaticus]|uniref:Oxidoreductase n=1 Tax=Fictibacillus aquaticus TaxID=2021314 RepID=A0A235F493_9BACL|nr:NAD(P)/FAD-dependent oxidoreductase [Fictibacillus aquaticus]OYD56062.1 oxidoreductase [Fictibacillus aquaticus]
MVFDVIVVGGGQAGLSMGYYLKKTGLSFVILDSGQRTGDVWRKRYDSLVLFTPRSYSTLHGLKWDGDPAGYPSKEEVADYLERYAQTYDLPVQHDSHVHSVEKENDLFNVSTSHTVYKGKKVVVATGAFQTPRIPAFAKELPSSIIQLHSSQYRNPGQLNDGPVLVVGGGNSGAQIAVELSATHKTYLSAGAKIQFMPLTIAGKSIFWWLEKTGILKSSASSWVGKIMRKRGDTIFGYELKEKVEKLEVVLKSRTSGLFKGKVMFDDSTSLEVSNVIWATGFVQNFDWIRVRGLFDAQGNLQHKRGVTPVEGLYFLGLPWQHRRGSALLLGVGDDAAYLYSQMTAELQQNKNHPLSGTIAAAQK